MTTEWESFFAAGNPGEKYITLKNGYPTWITGASESDFAKAAIMWAEKQSIKATAGPEKKTKPEGTTEDTYELTFGNLEPGYYVVKTSLGALCSLDTTETTVEIQDKNIIPTVDKKVNEEGTWGEENTAKIGDTVDFQATITVGKGTKSYVFHDKMGTGLTFDSTSVKVDGNDLTDKMHLTEQTADGCTFEIAFDDDYIIGRNEGDTISVTYQAVLNKDVSVEYGVNNDAWLKYGDNSSSTKKTTTTKVLTFDLVKFKEVNGTKELLAKAKFKLYDQETGGTEIPLVKQTDGSYRPAVEGEAGVEIETDGTAPIHIVGLDNKIYYLEETEAPKGFNKLTDRVEVNLRDGSKNAIVENGFYTGGIQVENKSGTLLPSTGGIGTTIFYVVGGILMAAAAVVLVTKKRMEKNV